VDEKALARAAEEARIPRLLDLGSDRCIPCKEMAPILEELRREYAGRAAVDFVDVWKHPEVAEKYEVLVIPTQIFFDREGRETWRHEGYLSREEIVAKLSELGAK
jgi:thioredoxin 1